MQQISVRDERAGPPRAAPAMVIVLCLAGLARPAGAACDIHISPPNPSTLKPASVGMPYSTTISATGGAPPYTFSNPDFGKLPKGLTIAPATGVISGTPEISGTYNQIEIDVADSTGQCVDSAIYTIVVSGGCTLTLVPAGGSTLPPGTVGSPYSFDFGESGGAEPVTFTADESVLPFPPGLTLSPDGVLSGKPTKAGSFQFRVKAVDHNGCTADEQYTINVTATAGCVFNLSPEFLPARAGSQTAAEASVQNTGAGDCTGTFEFDVSVNSPNTITAERNFGLTMNCSGTGTSQNCTGSGTLKPTSFAVEFIYITVAAHQDTVEIPWTLKWNDTVQQGLEILSVLPARAAQRIKQPPPRVVTWTIWK